MGQQHDEGGCNKFLEVKLVQHLQHVTKITGTKKNCTPEKNDLVISRPSFSLHLRSQLIS